MPNCDKCGQIHNDRCEYYCSRKCCEEAAYDSAAALGVPESYDAMREIEDCCGGCVY